MWIFSALLLGFYPVGAAALDGTSPPRKVGWLWRWREKTPPGPPQPPPTSSRHKRVSSKLIPGRRRNGATSAAPVAADPGENSRPVRGTRIRSGQGAPEARATALDLYEAYASIRDEYDRNAFHPSQKDKWTVIKKVVDHTDGDEIEIALLEHESDKTCPYVRMTAVVPGNLEEVWDFLSLDNWDRTMPKMDPFYESVVIVGRYSHHGVDMTLARKLTKRFLTFGKRDFTFVSVSDLPRPDGVWTSGTVSVVTEAMPRAGGYVRGFQDSIAFYRRMDGGRTHVTIVCRIDLNDSGEGGGGGGIPMWLYVKTIGTTGVSAMMTMKRLISCGNFG